MPMVTNKSARVIHLHGNMLVPGHTQEMRDEVVEHEHVKALIDSGDLEVSKKKAAEPAAAPVPAPAPAAKA